MISLVPEGFQLTVSLSLAITALGMAKRNVVVKRLSAIETIGSMTVLCVDKTGTITSGEMMVEKLWATGKVFEVTGDGYSPEGFVTVEGRRITRGRGPTSSASSRSPPSVPTQNLLPRLIELSGGRS